MKKIFTLALAMLASVGLWAAPTVNEGTYSTQTISEDWKTSTWTFITPSSQVNAAATKDVDIIYAPSSNGKMKFSSSNGFSWLGASSGYIYVPAGAAGTISMTVKSSSDSRWLQLYVSGSAAADSKRLWSKYAETASDGKKGPQSFAFTASDLTTIGDSTFLHFIDNNTELKIATISVVLTTGSYANCTDPEFTVSPTEGTGFVGDPIDIAVTSKNQSKPINSAVTVDGVPGVYGTDYTFSASTGLVQATPLKAGTFVVTFSQASNGTYCDAVESATFVISEKTPVASVTVDGPAAGFVGQELTYTATAANATAYQWLVDGVDANTNAATFKYTAVKGEHSIVCKARNEFNAEDAWIASDPIALKVTNPTGVLIAYNVETGSDAIDKDFTVSASESIIIGGTGHQKTQKNGKLGSNGHYISLTLASGSFVTGDTVRVVVAPEGDKFSVPATMKLSSNVDNTDFVGEATGLSATSSANITVDIILSKGASSLFLSRNSTFSQNPIVKSISVIRPVAVKSTVETLTAVTINDVAISESDLNKLVSGSSHTLILEDSYLNAPVVKFTKHTVITYEDDSQKESDEVIEETSTQATASTWGASATIGENSYSVYTVKTMSYVVTYMFGTEELGTENVAANGSPANYATYQTLNDGNLSTFAGWYNNADLAEGHAVADIAAEVITANTTYYAKFNYKYAESVNIEQLILDNGKSYDLMSLMGSKNYASNWTNDLDSLNDTKTARNEPYLGQKVKAAGKLLNFRLANGSVVKVKFGNVGKTPQASINGGDYANITITDGVYTYTAEAETLISIKTADGSTVVFKQIMIDEEIQTVILPDKPTALDNTEDSVKATKRIVNGQLLIEKNGVLYNAQGVVVK